MQAYRVGESIPDQKPIPTLDQLVAQRDSLGDTMLKFAEIKARKKALEEQLREANKILFEEYDFLNEAVKQGDAELTDGALRFFQANPGSPKQLTEGVTIKEVTQAIYEPQALFDYAVLKAPWLLKLDVRVVDDLALSIAGHQDLAHALSGMPLTAPKVLRADVGEDTLKKTAQLRQTMAVAV